MACAALVELEMQQGAGIRETVDPASGLDSVTRASNRCWEANCHAEEEVMGLNFADAGLLFAVTGAMILPEREMRMDRNY